MAGDPLGWLVGKTKLEDLKLYQAFYLCSSGFFLFCLPELGAYDMNA
jgi:hypothetical protein